MRARLQEANGTSANQVMLIADAAGTGAMTVEALTQMEAWLAAIEADDAPGTAARAHASEPSGQPDGRVLGGLDERSPSRSDSASRAPARRSTRRSRKPASPPARPWRATSFKCQLKPIDFGAYGVSFTPAQQARLQATFPTGVCDWSKPGVDERPPLGAWLRLRRLTRRAASQARRAAARRPLTTRELPPGAGAGVDAKDRARLDCGRDQVSVRQDGDVADVQVVEQDSSAFHRLEPAQAAADGAAAGEEQSPSRRDRDPVRVDAVDHELRSSCRRVDPPGPASESSATQDRRRGRTRRRGAGQPPGTGTRAIRPEVEMRARTPLIVTA